VARGLPIGAQVVQLRYRHAGDGKYYQHDFERSGTRLTAQPDGSLRISNPTARLWGDYGEMRFLENPPKRGRRKSRSRGRSKSKARRNPTRAKAAGRNPPARRRAKRSPPAGFSSWADWSSWMQGTRKKGGAVARRKGRRRSSGRSTARRRSSSSSSRGSTRRRRSYRRNPPRGFSVKGITGRAIQGATDGAGVLAGQIAARAIPTALKLPQAGTLGLAVQAGVGIGAGMVAGRMVNANLGRNMVAGAFAAIFASLVKRANVPVISAALGDEGDLVSAYPTTEIAAYPYGAISAGSEISSYPAGSGGPYGAGQMYSALDMQQ
jgi:hypothetical protein